MKKSNFVHSNNKLMNRLKREKPVLKIEKCFLHHLNSFVQKSKVINSSNIMRKQSINSKIKISEKWDKFDIFSRKKREISMAYATHNKMKSVIYQS